MKKLFKFIFDVQFRSLKTSHFERYLNVNERLLTLLNVNECYLTLMNVQNYFFLFHNNFKNVYAYSYIYTYTN